MHFLNESKMIKMVEMIKIIKIIKIIKMVEMVRVWMVMVISVKILTMWNDQRFVLLGEYISRHRSHTSIQTCISYKKCVGFDEYLDQDMT